MGNSTGLERQGSGAGVGRSAGSAIDVSSLGKTYATRGGSVEAVRNANFSVQEGEFVSLVGPSGCGKSTILKIVAGLVPYESGAVDVGGQAAAPGRQDVGIMFQSPVLFPWRTVLANVLLPIEIFDTDGRAGATRAEEVLKLVGLWEVQDKYPFELSGGMQQRVSLARLLVSDPKYMLMDEPFAALDEFNRERLNHELASIHEDFHRTVLYVTHNISEAVLMADRIVVLKSHPGEILDIVDVDLPRPRKPDVLDERQAQDRVAAISRLLRHSGGNEQGER